MRREPSFVDAAETISRSIFTEDTIVKKLIAVLVALLLSGLACSVQAGEYADLRTKLTAARESLIAMMLHKEQRDASQQKLVKDTADAVSAQLAKMKAPAGKEAQFKDLLDTWNAFKHTRETELVPAILKGNEDEAKKIAGGAQKDRYTKCQKLTSELEN